MQRLLDRYHLEECERTSGMSLFSSSRPLSKIIQIFIHFHFIFLKNSKYQRLLVFLFTKCLKLNWIATLGLEVSLPCAGASHLHKSTMNESVEIEIEWIVETKTVRLKSLGQMYCVRMIWRHSWQTSSHRIKSFSSSKSKILIRTSSTRPTKRKRWLEVTLMYLIKIYLNDAHFHWNRLNLGQVQPSLVVGLKLPLFGNSTFYDQIHLTSAGLLHWKCADLFDWHALCGNLRRQLQSWLVRSKSKWCATSQGLEYT